MYLQKLGEGETFMTTINGSFTTGAEFKNPVDTLKKATSGKFEPQLVTHANEPDTVEIGGKKKIDKKAVAKGIGVLAAVATITAGVVLAAKSGKFAKVGEVLEGLKPKQNLSLEEFQQKGGFEGGIAKLKNKLFTGTINVNKNGTNTIMQYKDGKIVSSAKCDISTGEPKFLFSKTYTYGADGTKEITAAYEDRLTHTMINPDKTSKVSTSFLQGEKLREKHTLVTDITEGGKYETSEIKLTHNREAKYAETGDDGKTYAPSMLRTVIKPDGKTFETPFWDKGVFEIK